MKAQHAGDAVAVRFFMPSPTLAPFVTTYYLTEVTLPEGGEIEDLLHPEWANLRFSVDSRAQVAVGESPLRPAPAFLVSGPTSHCTRFRTGRARIWGIGLLPLGWARLIDAAAIDHADALTDGSHDPAFAGLAPLLGQIFSEPADPTIEVARIDAFLLDYLAARSVHEDEVRIRAAHAALVDPLVESVADLARRLNMSPRSFERLSLRSFGFPPKLLLRRQRFLRSLAQFMLDPSLKWISTLDSQYVDQAHFVRDFKRFMGMSPSAYAALDHPVLGAAARARLAAAGEAVQVLHRPS